MSVARLLRKLNLRPRTRSGNGGKVTGLSWNVSSDARRPDSERSLTEVKCDFELLLLRTRMRMRRNHGTNTTHHNRKERLRANLKVRCQYQTRLFFSSDSTSQK